MSEAIALDVLVKRQGSGIGVDAHVATPDGSSSEMCVVLKGPDLRDFDAMVAKIRQEMEEFLSKGGAGAG